MTTNLSAHQARLLRMRAQHLSAPTASLTCGQLLSKIFAVQAQNLGAAYQSLGVRSQGLTEQAAAHERQHGDEICWRWSLRGTLHLMTVEDTRWYAPLMAQDLAAWDRLRLRQLGYDDEKAEKGVELIRSSIEKHGALTRVDLARLLQENNLPFEGQATVHILFKAVCEAGVCQGIDQGKKPTYILFEQRYGAFKPLPRAEGLAQLALRYLQAYAPARPEDFAAWSGVKISEVRALWPAIASSLAEVQVENTPNWLLKEQKAWLDGLDGQAPVLRLLPYFDTYVLGYANRDMILPKAFAGRVLNGGVIDAMVAVDGWIIGTWKLTPRKGGFEIGIQYFEEPANDLRPLIEAEAVRLGQFLEKPVTLV